MTSSIMRRLPSGLVEPQLQDENAAPFASRSSLAASPVRRMTSPSKLPTLGDIAARLNRDKDHLTPNSSPVKQPFGNTESPRPRLELTGRITGSPKPMQYDERKGPVLSLSPLKTSYVSQFEEPSSARGSPRETSSGASSPTKRMLANGLPSLEEIRDRMSRKGLVASGEEASPRAPSMPSSPTKLTASQDLIKTPVSVQASPMAPVHDATELKPVARTSNSSIARKPSLKISTPTLHLAPKMKHPLPASPGKSPSYPLQHEWTLFYDSRHATPSTPGLPPTPSTPQTPLTPTLWEANLRTIGTFSTVETLLPSFSRLRRPSQVSHSSYHIFKDGIKPMWEDPRNTSGGKWTITFRQRNPALTDRSWLWLVLGLIGEELDEKDEVCGAVCSVRPRGERIAVWVRDKGDVERVNGVGRRLLKLLELEKEPGVVMEFSAHHGAAEGLEEVLRVENAMQTRTPTMGSFGGQSGQTVPGAGAKLTPNTAAVTSGSPSSPMGKSFTRSPNTSHAAPAEPFARLTGQRTTGTNVFASTPPSTGSPFGALGQTLGLGIGISTSPNASPRPDETSSANPSAVASAQQPSGGAFSWRASDRSVSPRRRDATATGAGSRSTSPFKPL